MKQDVVTFSDDTVSVSKTTDVFYHSLWNGLALLLLGIVAMILASRRLYYPFFMDEIWVVRGVQSGQRDITPPLLFGLLQGLSNVGSIREEWLMRLPSLVAVTLSAVLLPAWAFLRRWPLRHTGTAWITGCLLAFSSPVLFYGSFVKNYAVDVLFAVFMTGMWVETYHAKRHPRYWLLFLIGAGFFLSATHTAIFLVAGFAVAFAWRWLFSGNRSVSEGITFVVVHVLLVALFLCSYYLWLRLKVSADSFHDPAGLEGYWANHFWDGSVSFLLERSRHVFGHQFNLVRGAWLVVALHIAAWGGMTFWRRSWKALGWFIFAATPIALVLLASFFRRYPYGEVRLILFSTPLVYALFAHTISENLSGRSWMQRTAWVLTAAFLIVFGFQGLFGDPYDTKFMGRVDDRPLYMMLRDHASSEQTPIFSGEMEMAGLKWYVESDAITVLPLADGSGSRWQQAWFVLNTRGWDAEWDIYLAQKERLGFEALIRFSHRPGLRAILVRRHEKVL